MIKSILDALPEKDEGYWLRTDEKIEFYDNVAHVLFLLKAALKDRTKWKWVILAMHNALESAFVCHLRGNDPLGHSVLNKDSAKRLQEWVNKHDNNMNEFPKNLKLAAMLELFNRVNNSIYLSTEHQLKWNNEREEIIKKINYWRNEFDHFQPQSWSIEISGYPNLVIGFCDILDEILGKNLIRDTDDFQNESVKILLTDIRDKANMFKIC